MSTPGSPGGQQPGVNPFAETAQRDIGSGRISLDKNSTEQFAPGGYPQQMPDHGYQQQYPPAQYPQGQYPQGQYPMTGYPTYPQQGSGNRGVFIGLAVACIIVLLVACVFVWIKVSDKGSDDSTTADAPITNGQTALTTTTVADPETQAVDDLAAATATDTAYMRANHDNRWSAQISAKRPGLFAEGRTWDNPAIYNEYVSMKQRYPNVRLLRSSEWPVFTSGDWWIIVSAQAFPSPVSALSWCVSRSLDKDHCFAKLISSTSGPDGSTLYQR